VVVAVLFVRPMQPPVDQVIDVIAVRDRLVTALIAVSVRRIAVGGTLVACGVRLIDRDRVVVDMIAVRVVQVAVVEIVDVVLVANRGVPATGPVLVRVVALMDVVGHDATLRLRVAVRKPATAQAFGPCNTW
jgi:phage tail protein X